MDRMLWKKSTCGYFFVKLSNVAKAFKFFENASKSRLQLGICTNLTSIGLLSFVDWAVCINLAHLHRRLCANKRSTYWDMHHPTTLSVATFVFEQMISQTPESIQTYPVILMNLRVVWDFDTQNSSCTLYVNLKMWINSYCQHLLVTSHIQMSRTGCTQRTYINDNHVSTNGQCRHR